MELSQYPSDYKGIELGFNVTTVLSRFIGNTTGFDSQTFPFLIRFHNKKSAFRIGIGGNFKSDNFFDPTTGTVRDTEERAALLKLGYERKIELERKLTFYYGLDVFAGLVQEKVSTNNFSSTEISKNITRIGGGPLVGISYSVNERVRFHTETNILAFYESSTTNESLNGAQTLTFSNDSFRAVLEAPISLFINLKF